MTSQLRLNDMLRVLTLGLVIVTQAQAEEGDSVGIQIDTKVQTYVQNYCVTCHGEDEQEGDRRLDILPTDFGNDDTVILYEEILDQLNLGEMPPNKKSVKQPKVEETAEVVASLTNLLESVTESKQKHVSVLRRLNRLEYKNTVSELLGVNTINVDPTKNFPSDERVHGFLNIGEAQVTSDVLMQHYLNAADKFIDKAVHFGPAPQTTKVLIEASQFEITTKRARSKVYWRLLKEDRVEIGHGYPERYVNYPSGYAKRGAPVDGYYKIRIKAAGLNRLNHPYEDKDFRKNFDLSQKMQLSLGIATDKVAIEGASRENRRIDSIFELNDNEPAVHEVVVWMDKGSIPYFNWRNGIGNPRGFINLVANKYHKENEQLIFNLNEANRLHLEPKSRQFKPKGKDLISEVYQGPRIAIYNVEVEGPIIDEWPPASHRKIFGEAKTPKEVNVAEMIQKFAQRAFRRPVKAEEVSHYVDFVKKVEAAGKSTEEALKQGLKAILVSPRFIYLAEGAEGELDDYQLASRLSYSLWSSMPDQELLDVAAEGKLKDPVVRREQTLRMLQDKRAQHFIKGFTDAWLRLDKLGSMPPDPRAYANYYNLHLEGAMRQETLLFINHFVEENLPVKTMLDADFTFLNWGLAKHYGVPDIDGLEMRKVTLPKRSRRNGLLGHGSILTLTANNYRNTEKWKLA